jgi:hypothetical protein
MTNPSAGARRAAAARRTEVFMLDCGVVIICVGWLCLRWFGDVVEVTLSDPC